MLLDEYSVTQSRMDIVSENRPSQVYQRKIIAQIKKKVDFF